MNNKTFGLRLCELFEIDSETANKINIEVDGNNIPILTVTFFVVDEKQNELIKLLNEYKLEKKATYIK